MPTLVLALVQNMAFGSSFCGAPHVASGARAVGVDARAMAPDAAALDAALPGAAVSGAAAPCAASSDAAAAPGAPEAAPSLRAALPPRATSGASAATAPGWVCWAWWHRVRRHARRLRLVGQGIQLCRWVRVGRKLWVALEANNNE